MSWLKAFFRNRVHDVCSISQRQIKECEHFLQTQMGQQVNRQLKEKIPINLSKEEVNQYTKRFESIDKEKKGYVSITDIKRAMRVRMCLQFRNQNQCDNVISGFRRARSQRRRTARNSS